MAFPQFTFPKVVTDLNLTSTDQELTASIAEWEVRPEFEARIHEGMKLAGAINTEKARSEFVIAPVLFEFRRTHRVRFGLFSGVEIDADASRGLNGVCDFLLTRSPNQHFVDFPVLMVAEAKVSASPRWSRRSSSTFEYEASRPRFTAS